jgi:hypothetical protein
MHKLTLAIFAAAMLATSASSQNASVMIRGSGFRYTLYLNGAQVSLQDAAYTATQPATRVDNLPLRQGENVVAIDATCLDSVGLASLKAGVLCPDGVVGSDSTWTYAWSAPAGWNSVGFDGSLWGRAGVQHCVADTLSDELSGSAGYVWVTDMVFRRQFYIMTLACKSLAKGSSVTGVQCTNGPDTALVNLCASGSGQAWVNGAPVTIDANWVGHAPTHRGTNVFACRVTDPCSTGGFCACIEDWLVADTPHTDGSWRCAGYPVQGTSWMTDTLFNDSQWQLASDYGALADDTGGNARPLYLNNGMKAVMLWYDKAHWVWSPKHVYFRKSFMYPAASGRSEQPRFSQPIRPQAISVEYYSLSGGRIAPEIVRQLPANSICVKVSRLADGRRASQVTRLTK